MTHVFTIFCHGTGSSSKDDLVKKKGEIITAFGQAFRRDKSKTEFEDFIILEGPGSQGSPENIEYVKKDGHTIARVTKSNYLIKGKAPGLIWGRGVERNYENAAKAIWDLFRSDKEPGIRPGKINMVGWSRGAVTCIRLAYYLNRFSKLSLIPVNIFAIDPVAGGSSHKDLDAHILNKNVKTYVATLSLQEIRKGFTPIDHRILKGEGNGFNNRLILPLKGIHDDTAQRNNPAGKITAALCYRFLEKMGTTLPGDIKEYKMDNEKMLNAYSNLRKDARFLPSTNRYRKKNPIKQHLFLLKPFFKPARTKIKTSNLVTDSQFFINAHHRWLFEKLYPDTYKAYFGQGKASRYSSTWKKDYQPDSNKEMWSIDIKKSMEYEDQLLLENLREDNTPIWHYLQRREVMNKCGFVD